MTKFPTMGFTLLLAALAIASPASAELAGVWHGEARSNDIFLGSIIVDDAFMFQVIVSIRGDKCEISQMGLLGLGGDWRFYLSEGDDYLDIIRESDRPIVLCGWEIGPLNFAGATVTVYGGGGNDEIRGGDGITWVSGGEGDDVLYSGCADGSEVHGGAGNDVIYGCWQSDSEILYGDEGDDTFCEYWDDANHAKAIDGNDGFDCINAEGSADDFSVEAFLPSGATCPL